MQISDKPIQRFLQVAAPSFPKATDRALNSIEHADLAVVAEDVDVPPAVVRTREQKNEA